MSDEEFARAALEDATPEDDEGDALDDDFEDESDVASFDDESDVSSSGR